MLESPNTRVQALWKLKDSLDKGQILLDAPYQRDVVWTKSKMTILIDSVMNNIYIPPLVFEVRRLENGKIIRMCIDGKQRLTSIWKFMNNEVPFVDEGIERYFEEDLANIQAMDSNPHKEYLSDAQRKKFVESELVCVEYSGLEPGQELEIFSRVQNGVTLTSAEKLRANNSPIAQYANEMEGRYIAKIDPIYPGKRALLYSEICTLCLLLKDETDDSSRFVANMHDVVLLLKDKDYIPTNDIKEKVQYTLDVYSMMAKHSKIRESFHYNGPVLSSKRSLRSMEFLMFGLFITKCMPYRNRNNGLPDNAQLLEFGKDFRDMRHYCKHSYGGSMRAGSPAYLAIKRWIHTRLESIVAHHGSPMNSITDLDPETVDELDDDDDDDMQITEHPLNHHHDNEVHNGIRGKRRQSSIYDTPIPAVRPAVRPVARRGRKYVTPSGRR